MATMPVNADAPVGLFELRALFDMHFKEASVATGFDLHPRLAFEPGLAKGVPQRGSVAAIAAGIEFLIGELADDGTAAEEAPVEVAFFIGKGAHINGQPGAGKCDPSDDTKGAVEPSCLVL
jgi:hypothetical protein